MILVTGGTRSGKSGTAERLAGWLGGRVLYVATAEPGDDEMRLRIERHQAARPADWGTLNAPRDAVNRLREVEGQWDTILFDCLTLYTTNMLLEHEADSPDPELVLTEDMQSLADYIAEVLAPVGGGDQRGGFGHRAGSSALPAVPRPAGPGEPALRRKGRRGVLLRERHPAQDQGRRHRGSPSISAGLS